MDDDWDNDTISSPVTYNSNPVDFGTSFGKGRGFIAQQYASQVGKFNNDNNEWDNSESYGNGDYDRAKTDRGRRGFNGDSDGGGRRGGRGGRGGREERRGGGGNRGRQDDDSNDYRGSQYSNDGGHRGGRNERDGASQWGRRKNEDEYDDGGFQGSRNNENKKEGTDAERPRVTYIPPEINENEDQMFSSGCGSGINFDKYDNIKVKVTGDNVPRQIESFESSGLSKLLIENVIKSGYKKPTPVQKHSIPIIMEGRDLMACAQTGSGKTAAFLLPIINTILRDPRDMGITSTGVMPHAVIISPTRELTSQIFKEAKKFSHGSMIRCAEVYGGVSTFYQKKQVMNGCHILVATPGRLMDFVNRGHISFEAVRFAVLDEADRMLDMGFLPEMEKFLKHPTMVEPGERQTLMFSATFPEEIQRLAWNFMNNYLFLAVGIVGGACADVEQRFHMVNKFDKRNKLLELLTQEGSEGTLVFVETKRTADFIAAYICENNIPTTSIHGDREQREREEALRDFKSGRMKVLVATAVAARGLDIKNVCHVINFDLPKDIAEYVHRIGRTGRVGNRGKATSFYDPDQDAHLARSLIKTLSETNQNIPPWLDEAGNSSSQTSSFSRGSRFGGRDVRSFGKNSGNDDFGSSSHTVTSEPLEQDEEWD